jgi:hypothetical protein
VCSSIIDAALADLDRDRYATDPLAWTDHHDLELWSKQRDILKDVAAGHRLIGVPSGHGTGKSALASRILDWAGDTATGDDTLVAVVSPTAAQLGNIMRPARELHRRLGLPGYITRGPVPTWTIDDREVALGRSVSDTSLATLVGLHARRLIVIVDEADGISAPVWEQILSLVTGRDNQLIAFGNPRNPSSRWKALIDGGGWATHHISVLDTPAFTGEVVSDELLSVLPSQEWVDDRRRDYGEGTALWDARVAGRWPREGELTVIPLTVFQAAVRDRDSRPEDAPEYADDRPTWILDVARSGGDRTVFSCIVDRQLTVEHIVVGQDTNATSQQAKAFLDRHVGSRIVIDGDGVGGGVVDNLRNWGYGHRTIEFRGAEKARATNRFVNRRAEAHWTARQMLQGKTIDGRPAPNLRIVPNQPIHTALPTGTTTLEVLEEEATAPAYIQDPQGRILIERKDDITRRIGRSPDLGDTLMMGAWALGGPIVQAEGPRSTKASGVPSAAAARRRRRRRA